MFKTLPILLLLAAAYCQDNWDVDSVFKNFFGPPSSTEGDQNVVSTPAPPVDKNNGPSTIMPPVNQSSEMSVSILAIRTVSSPSGFNLSSFSPSNFNLSPNSLSEKAPATNSESSSGWSSLTSRLGFKDLDKTISDFFDRSTTNGGFQKIGFDGFKGLDTRFNGFFDRSRLVGQSTTTEGSQTDGDKDTALIDNIGSPTTTGGSQDEASTTVLELDNGSSTMAPPVNPGSDGAKDLDRVLSDIFGPSATTGGGQLDNGSSTMAPPVNPGSYDVGPQDLSCKLPNGQVGECISYYLCDIDNNTVIADGVGVIDIRVRDGPCESYIDTCCPVSDKKPPDQPIKPQPKPDEPEREGCGWANPDGAGLRTIGETNGETKFGEFPWMVAILKIELVDDSEPDGEKLNVYIGGGSLIHPSVVLTAGTTNRDLKVRAGEWDTQSTKEIYPFQDRYVSSVETHKDFNKGNLFYNIAILHLAKPMDLAPNVGVACLPPARQPQEDGTRCFATGWGKDKFGKEGSYQVILKKIELPVVKHDKCQAALRKTRLGKFFQLHSTFMCAGGEPGKDTCKGDGGSPLSCPIEHYKDRYVQSGIVAWGIGCGGDGTPGVYVDISVLRNWIDDKVAGKGYDPKTYSF